MPQVLVRVRVLCALSPDTLLELLQRMLQNVPHPELRACISGNVMCAEVFAESHVSRASDVYSFGMMMLEMFTGKPLFPGMGHPQVCTRTRVLWHLPDLDPR